MDVSRFKMTPNRVGPELRLTDHEVRSSEDCVVAERQPHESRVPDEALTALAVSDPTIELADPTTLACQAVERREPRMFNQPAVFCMDEPLSNLDAKLRSETRAELVDLHRRLDATIIYVTHDQVEAMTMGTRVAVMNHGQLQQIGTPQEVYAKPETVFVATFIGTPPMNVMPRRLVRAQRCARRCAPRAPAGSIRRWRWAGATVRLVEQLGHETLLICDAAGTRVVVRQDAEAAGTADRGRDRASTPRRRIVTGSTRVTTRIDQTDRCMKRKWRDLPIAVGMLAPSAVILGVFVVYPLVRAIQLGHLRCDATGRRCTRRRMGSVHRRLPQQRVPTRAWPTRHGWH